MTLKALWTGLIGLSLISCKMFTFNGSRGDSSPSYASGYGQKKEKLTASEALGLDIWYKATAGNKFHHSYVLAQRFDAPIDWYRIFGSPSRGKRFAQHGLIPDPDCRPGNDSSYGFDLCEGDEELLKYVGKEGYKDPACNLQAPGLEDACRLEFGTSAGALGYRKFPNPRFKKENWKGWEKYDPKDASIEPPFLFGTSCGSCHIGFDPLRPPQDVENPKWENIDGTVGNMFLDVTAIFTSGFGEKNIFWQALSHVRPGTTDTSAVPNDMIHNPGTINAIINLDKRPTFEETVTRWRRENPSGPWSFGTKKESVMHILKGGEDSVGADVAVIRVYVNIGMCSEQCWQNNLIHIKQFSGPGLSQRPFDIAQCRKDCGYWRSVEDRLPDLVNFLLHRRPTDLKDAIDERGQRVGDSHLREVKAKFDSQYTEEGGVFEAGRRVFARECARCHSSLKPKLPGQTRDEAFFLKQDFLKIDDKGVRLDWLGNDERVDASLVGTVRCRALHDNHNKGRIWEQFSSETFKASATPSGIPELQGKEGSGRGYYRNLSLLSLWAHAPFMHNNAIGPEQCGPNNKQDWPCVKADPSIEGRIARYEASMKELLYPETRQEKISRTSETIGLTVTVPFTQKKIPLPVQLSIPQGTPVALLGSLDMKSFVNDLLNGLGQEIKGKNTIETARILQKKVNEVIGSKDNLLSTLGRYSRCTDLVENKGHIFGAELSQREKNALIQYLKNF
jgi:hypothetical protein